MPVKILSSAFGSITKTLLTIGCALAGIYRYSLAGINCLVVSIYINSRSKFRFAGPNFELYGYVRVAAMTISIALATSLYVAEQKRAQRGLYEAYKNADVVTALCGKSVALSADLCKKNQSLSFQQIYMILIESEAIDSTEYPAFQDMFDSYKEPFEPGNNKDADEAGRDEKSANVVNLQNLKKEIRPLVIALQNASIVTTSGNKTALTLITRITTEQCKPDTAQEEIQERTEILAEGLAYHLADLGGHRKYRQNILADKFQKLSQDQDFVNKSRCDYARESLRSLRCINKPMEQGSDVNVTLDQNCNGESNSYSLDEDIDGFRFSSQRCLSDIDVLTELTRFSKVIGETEDRDAGYTLESCKSFEGELKGTDAFLVLNRFARVNQYLLGLSHTLPEVKAAKTRVDFGRAIEHIGILSLAIFFILLFTIRTAVIKSRFLGFVSISHMSRLRKPVGSPKNAEETIPYSLRAVAMDLRAGGDIAVNRLDAIARGRTYLRWAIATVPAIGFIGTVRGIYTSLSGAGDVVWATTRLERAEAIGGLAGQLGVAFSTTLVALMVGVVLGFIGAWSRNYEGRKLDQLVGVDDIPQVERAELGETTS